MTPKAQITRYKAQVRKLNYMKGNKSEKELKNKIKLKQTNKKVKRQTMKWEKMCANYIH